MLAPWAVTGTPSDTLSRREHAAPDTSIETHTRSPFQIDRERIVRSRAFRRLAGKTQVFTSRSSDHFRSRLTHTIEVTQIARDVARRLALNEELAEALALVHDIGHPPFGHAGERALDDCLRQRGLRFDHNLHALRICEHFEQRHAGHRGLDLTLGVREGIVKHSREYTAAERPELRAYFLEERPPLEAQMIDLVDEIAYLTADLDDGVESGLLDIVQIRGDIALLGECYAEALALFPGAEEKFLFHEALQLMQTTLTDDLVETTRSNLRAIGAASLEDVRRSPVRIAHLSPEREAQRREQKAYMLEHLYNCPDLLVEHAKAEKVIRAMFMFWSESPEELPPGYTAEVEQDGVERVVADYIAGMTDAFILQQYASVQDRSRR